MSEPRMINLTPELWTRLRDVAVVALIPGFMWLTGEVRRGAELSFEVTSHKAQLVEIAEKSKEITTLSNQVAMLKAQLDESRQALSALRQDYNTLNLQMVEVKSVLRGIQETLSDVRKQLAVMDERQRAFESDVRGFMPVITPSPVVGSWGSSRNP